MQLIHVGKLTELQELTQQQNDFMFLKQPLHLSQILIEELFYHEEGLILVIHSILLVYVGKEAGIGRHQKFEVKG